MFIESFCRNSSPFHSLCSLSFCDFTWLPPKSSSPLYLWRTLMKFRVALNFSAGMVFVIMSARFFFVLIFTKSINLSSTTHWHILWYLTSICFILLWYLWSFTRWITLYHNEFELNPALYQKSRPILSTTKLPLMPQLQPCTLPLSLKE